MAARKNLRHPEKVRQRIRTSQLINRLTKHVFGKVEMSATQVTAALGVLRKSLPDLTATEISGELTRRDITDKPLTAEEWAAEHCVETAARTPESTH